MENSPANFPAWPGDAEVAVALTFDVDGEAPWLSEGPEYAGRLTMLSQGSFGPGRGLARILSLLAELEITATFYVPGYTAGQHSGAVEAILAGGHEVGHHGYLHRGWPRMPRSPSWLEPRPAARPDGGKGSAKWQNEARL
jgi:Polysaccharide deacetylase